jgi:DNA-binding beta-propeller fold protein YncE
LLGAAHRPPPLIVYSAPAGERPAGADAVHPTTAILPNGRIASPAGRTVFVGTNPLGMALSPDGRFAIVSNDDERGGPAAAPLGEVSPVSGYSLAVVDTATMKLASTYRDPSVAFFVGVAALRDPRDPAATLVLASDGVHGSVRVFELGSGGGLVPDGAIALPRPGGSRPFPAGIAVESGVAYVADNLENSITAIDVASRSVSGSFPVGDFPVDVAAAGKRVLVSSAGLGVYRVLAPAAAMPQFADPAFESGRSSSLAVLNVGPGSGAGADPWMLPMDPAPDGSRIVGGAAPAAIAMRRDGRLAYVALANVDRVAVVALTPNGARVVRGLDLRLFPDAPYGAQPSAEALSRDGKRLYVALAGLNAVAVLDARTSTRYRYGLIPTAWYPNALALSPSGRYLYVVSAKGVDGWGTLSRIDLKHTSLVKATMETLRYNRTAGIAKENAVVPPLRSNKRSVAIDRIVYVAVGVSSYDSMLGDLKDSTGAPIGNGDPAYVQNPETATPNLHALARTYGVADNFYAVDADLDTARMLATNAEPTVYAQRLARVRSGRGEFGTGVADPEDYGRFGSLFDAVARAGLSYRDYGGLLQLSGYGDGRYHLDVPALAALNGNVDAAYPAGDAGVDDARRAQEFVTDMKRYVDADRMPSFTYVWLPTAPQTGGVSAADRALGTIVDFLSHSANWNSTAVFVVPEGLKDGSDHVNPLRSYCVVVSPYARRGYVGHAHLSVPSVVKTEEEILGLPPLTLGDLLATDMADFFSTTPSPQPYEAAR